MWLLRSRRRRLSLNCLLVASVAVTSIGLLVLTIRFIDSSTDLEFPVEAITQVEEQDEAVASEKEILESAQESDQTSGNNERCATVEEMADAFGGKLWEEESLRVRNIIQHHFTLNGPLRVRQLPPEQFCRHGFVMGKSSEAGFGNEMYKILTAAALSVMLNRSLIIGQTRGKYPFEDFITYSNLSFTLKEVKHLWRHNGCATKYGRNLVMRIDDFQKPAYTCVLCSNWREWKQPIIWFQNTTDAMAAQFFLKNIHSDMRKAAADLFGRPENLHSRPNLFGELMRVLISPSENVQQAVKWALRGGSNPDIVLHMRMLMNRSLRALKSASDCIRKAMRNLQLSSRPTVVLVSDTPSTLEEIASNIHDFAEVIHFNYGHFKGNISSSKMGGFLKLSFRKKDWGPAPRWVAFVDFFLASHAKYAVVSGAHRRVGTTNAQLIAALAAAKRLEKNSSGGSSFSFFCSFQSTLLSEGLRSQVGWGHAWNRFAGPLSCNNQSNQCALTPFLPPTWWDGLWQSPSTRDIQRMKSYGIQLSGFGTFDEDHLRSFCYSRKNVVSFVPLI